MTLKKQKTKNTLTAQFSSIYKITPLSKKRFFNLVLLFYGVTCVVLSHCAKNWFLHQQPVIVVIIIHVFLQVLGTQVLQQRCSLQRRFANLNKATGSILSNKIIYKLIFAKFMTSAHTVE